jgi:hypothetical protein
MILYRQKITDPSLHSQEQLSTLFKRKSEILKSSKEDDALKNFIKGLKVIDDIIVFYTSNQYSIYIYNPLNGRKATISLQEEYDYDTGEFRKGPKKYTLTIGNSYATATILTKRNLFVGENFSRNQVLEIAKNWVLHDKIPDFLRKKYTSVFQSKK